MTYLYVPKPTVRMPLGQLMALLQESKPPSEKNTLIPPATTTKDQRR